MRITRVLTAVAALAVVLGIGVAASESAPATTEYNAIVAGAY